jgi:hypothetical protein
MRKASGNGKVQAMLAGAWTCGLALGLGVFSCVAQAEDYSLPHGPYSAEIEHFKGRIDEIDDFSVFSQDDVILKVAYRRVFQCIVGDEFHCKEPDTMAAFADLRRRGDSATPMLLKLMEENQENKLETSILAGITGVDTIDPQPFVEYARTVLRERTATMNAFLAMHAAMLLQKRGSSEDLELLRWVAVTRPFVAASVKPSIRALDLRLEWEKQPKDRPAKDNRDRAELGGKVGEAPRRQPDSESVGERTASVKWIPALGLLAAILLIGAATVQWLRRGKARI